MPTGVAANGGTGMTANLNDYFVVSPRLSDGCRTSDADSPVANTTPNRKRFYVIVLGFPRLIEGPKYLEGPRRPRCGGAFVVSGQPRRSSS